MQAGSRVGSKSTLALLTIVTASFLSFASSATALTLGVGWSGNPAANGSEMPLVGKSGASTFRTPPSPGKQQRRCRSSRC